MNSKAPSQDEIDAARERVIADIIFLMLESRNRGERYELWKLLQERIAMRSPAQIRRMEAEKGLK